MIKKIIVLILVVIILGVILLIIDKFYSPMEEKDYINKLEIKSNYECDKPNLYMSLENYNIYTYCVESIKVTNQNTSNSKELKDFLEIYNDVIDSFILNNKLTKEDKLGKLYEEKTYNIIRCTNKDYYISAKELNREICEPL